MDNLKDCQELFDEPYLDKERERERGQNVSANIKTLQPCAACCQSKLLLPIEFPAIDKLYVAFSPKRPKSFFFLYPSIRRFFLHYFNSYCSWVQSRDAE